MKQLTEAAIIQHLQMIFKRQGSTQVLGIGDDAALIPHFKHGYSVISTDVMVEGNHFLVSKSKPEDVGYKSLATNISDLAAMGARPVGFFLNLVLPRDTSFDWVLHFSRGLVKAARKFNTPLLGGDTVSSQSQLNIGITIVGERRDFLVGQRSQAKNEDVVFTTGFLGDSAAGLKILLQSRSFAKVHRLPLVQKHLRPKPRLKEGEWLARQDGLGAMMDISDGLHNDLNRIIQASKCGFKIHLEKIPNSRALQQACRRFGWSALQLSVEGGEDYELLFTVRKSRAHQISQGFLKTFGEKLWPLGEVVERPKKIVYLDQGFPSQQHFTTYSHF